MHIIFESQDHQEIMTLDSASKTLDSIALDGTIEGETIDALFKLKESHPWFGKIRTRNGDGTEISPAPILDARYIDTHYAITFSKQETEDWMDGMWASGDGWTSHSNIVWRAKVRD
tara:strand:- start:116 stop:463 length:348 start_codon:yes stop_codon:yes gene_type:complete